MDLSRFRPWLGSDDSVRFCGLRLETLERALGDAKIVDALVDQLEVPGKTSVLKALNHEQKLQAIEEQIESFRTKSTSVWYEVGEAEILAASIWRAQKLGSRILGSLFASVKRESDLLAPVAGWLKAQGLETFPEVPLGRCRADVVGYREKGWLRDATVWAVELKADDEQMKRGFDQMATYGAYAQRVYMACTPADIADHLDRHSEARGVRHWDHDVLYRKLREHGFGLIVVEGERSFAFIDAAEGTPEGKKLAEAVASIGKVR